MPVLVTGIDRLGGGFIEDEVVTGCQVVRGEAVFVDLAVLRDLALQEHVLQLDRVHVRHVHFAQLVQDLLHHAVVPLHAASASGRVDWRAVDAALVLGQVLPENAVVELRPVVRQEALRPCAEERSPFSQQSHNAVCVSFAHSRHRKL